MFKKVLISLAVMGMLVSNSEARSHHHHHNLRQSFIHHYIVEQTPQFEPQHSFLGSIFEPLQNFSTNLVHSAYNVAHPAFNWCGWWMREHIAKLTGQSLPPDYNRAVEWAHFGHRVSGPQVGAIAVKRHHVMQITRVLGPGRIEVISGNSGNRRVCGGPRHCVTTNVRSTAGIIAYRMP